MVNRIRAETLLMEFPALGPGGDFTRTGDNSHKGKWLARIVESRNRGEVASELTSLKLAPRKFFRARSSAVRAGDS